MEDILFFQDPSNSEEGDDLPWAKDFFKSYGGNEKCFEIFECKPGDKGLYMVSGRFKAFMFRREKVYRHLIEAFETWADTGLPTRPLVVAWMNKKLHYGIANHLPEVRWYEDEGKYYSKRIDDTPVIIRSNPFLNPPNSPAISPTEPVNIADRPKRSRNLPRPEAPAS